MLRRAHITAVLASLIACGSPAGAPPPPADRQPPPPAALDCPPVARFAHDWFYMADLGQRLSCEVFVEQDECVLAIFDDCTSERPRQWEGRIDREGMIRMNAIFAERRPFGGPVVCEGPLVQGDTPRATLGCDGRGALYLEAVDDDAEPWGTRLGSFQVITRGRAIIDLLSDVEFVGGATRRQLWVVAAIPESPQEALIHVQDLEAGGLESRIRLSEVRAIAKVPGEDVMIAGSGQGLHFYDIDTLEVTRTATTNGGVELLEITDAGLIYVVTRREGPPFERWVEIRDPTGTMILRGPVKLQTVPIDMFAVGPEVPQGDLLISSRNNVNPDDGSVLLLDGDLQIVWEELPGFVASQAEYLPSEARLLLVPLFRNAYVEMDVNDPRSTVTVGVPYFGSLRSLAYDPDNDRTYVGGAEGLVYIDRGELRAVQTPLRSPTTAFRLIREANGLVYSLETERGFVEIIRPNP